MNSRERAMVLGVLDGGALAALAIAVAALLWRAPALAWLPLLPAAALVAGWRAKAAVRDRHERVVEQLERSVARLDELNQVKDDFVAAVSHELRTPLTSIRGYVDLLLRPGVRFSPDEQQEFLIGVRRQSDRLRRLIEDLRVVAKINAGADAPELTELRPDVLVGHVLDEARATIGRRRVTLALGEVPVVHSDTGKVHQILLNLVDNAFKYSPPLATVTVGSRAEAGGLVLWVADEGTGIPPEAVDRIFERFYRAERSSGEEGSGLGLFISRRLAAMVGGRLWLERTSVHGSVFSLWLPATPPSGHLPRPVAEHAGSA